MASLKERIIEKVLEYEFISKEELDKVLSKYSSKSGSFGKFLIKEGVITQRDYVLILSRELYLPTIDLTRYKIEHRMKNCLTEKFCRQWSVVPVSQIGEVISIAMSDPCDIVALDNIKSKLPKVDIIVASEKEVLAAIDELYSSEELKEDKEPFPAGEFDMPEKEHDIEVDLSSAPKEEDIEAAIKESQTPPIVKIVNLILIEGLTRRASDIHIEPTEGNLKVRYRIDGKLKDAMSLPKQNQNAVLARIKIMSGMDITENRFPQDGRFGVKFRNREIDFRVSVFPVTNGGKIVLRALDVTNLQIGLDKLGFLEESQKQFEKAIRKPFGMILVTGPTGSGKSTTLYSILNQLNTPDKNIITIEDPVEYELEGISQIQVHADIGLTFANGLRSCLRQSPDIMLVGEIRDYETADIAIKAALTGHLLFSTLHTNDAAGAVTRLRDMGVESYLISSALILVAAQRLMRKICPHCAEPVEHDKGVLEEEGVTAKDIEKATFLHGKGCEKCNFTGYLGRIGVLEILVPDDAMREMILKGASSDEIKEYAFTRGFVTLRENALKKFLMGQTTLEEVIRVTTEN